MNQSLDEERAFLMKLIKKIQKEIVLWNKDISRIRDRIDTDLDMVESARRRINQIDSVGLNLPKKQRYKP